MVDLNKTFAALADPIRRGILERLSHGSSTVGELARPLPISWPAVSKHLRVLESAGLIDRRRSGKNHILEIKTTPLEFAQAWIDTHRRFWEGSLDQLARYLEAENGPPKPRG